jgi:Zn-finger nucleic acid-binding protein
MSEEPVLLCPTCKLPLAVAGYTVRCGACDGAWVHEDALVGMLQERTSTLVFLPWQPRPKDTERGCPVCTKPMATANLGTVALDRCAEHGVWFDSGELAALLKEAKQFKTEGKHDEHPPEHSGLLGALARLFHR